MFSLILRRPPTPTLFPYTTLFRSLNYSAHFTPPSPPHRHQPHGTTTPRELNPPSRSEEHTSELQSRFDIVCRLLLEKKKQPQEQDFISIVSKSPCERMTPQSGIMK